MKLGIADSPPSTLTRYALNVVLRPVRPMLATSADEMPVGHEWTYEVKWDGYRTLALKNGQRVTLLSRNLKDATRNTPQWQGM